MASWTYCNDLINTLGYDTDGRLTGIDVPGVQSLALSYDGADRISRIANGIDGTLVRNSAFLVLLLLVVNACASEPSRGKLVELRQLPEVERMLAFSRLDEGEKIELFFQANRRHPPYAGLNGAFGKGGKDFLVRLRGELDERGGVPEVLSFLVIVSDLKRRDELSSRDMQDLRISGICQLAKAETEYCPELEAKLLVP